ncbi:MAG TPA: hypothetical protein VD862_03110 [Candidatus Paceibacterota bacterium]|nr:hypothetical protein [Candidatus Paceibacterota bacterium]
MRGKLLILALVAGLGFSGQAARAEDTGHIPADTAENFLLRYRYFVTKDERKAIEKVNKELKKLAKRPDSPEKTAEQDRLVAERDALIVAFWRIRDMDPSTPENEFKDLVDERFADIADEWFFMNTESPGLLFRSNGGFYGDMSRVFQLHGPPHALGMVEGQRFVPLMLWIYLNPESGRIRYAFLFYERMGGSEFRLFNQDAYKMDLCGAVNEIMQFRNFAYTPGIGCPEDVQLTYRELARTMPRTGNLGAYIFVWALQNVSEDPSETQGKALDAPLPAGESAQQSGAHVTGEPPKLTGEEGTDYLRSACDRCNSLIPSRMELDDALTITISRKHLDWSLSGETATCPLTVRAVFEYVDDARTVLAFDVRPVLEDTKSAVAGQGDEELVIPVVSAEEIAALRPGWYRVSVYLRNDLTYKYAAWNTRFVRVK